MITLPKTTVRFALLFVLSYIPIVLSADVPGSPNASTIETSIRQGTLDLDLGELFVGESWAREILITNDTKHRVRVDSIKASCGCSKAETDRRDLVPGDRESLKLQVRTTKNAPIKSSVVVTFDDLSVLTIRLSARVENPVEFAESEYKHEPETTVRLNLNDKELLSDLQLLLPKDVELVRRENFDHHILLTFKAPLENGERYLVIQPKGLNATSVRLFDPTYAEALIKTVYMEGNLARLLIKGDPSLLSGTGTLTTTKTVTVNVTVEKQSATAGRVLLTLDERIPTGSAKLTVNERVVSFNLR